MTNQQEIIAKLESGNNAILSKIFISLMADHDRAKCIKNWDLYKGDHDILDRTQDEPTKPNNQLVNDYPGDIVDTSVGYFVGIPISYMHKDEGVLAEISLTKRRCNEELHNERIAREAAITGKAYEIIYQNEEAEPCFMKCPASEMLLVRDGSNEDRIVYAMRYYPITINDTEATKIELYDDRQLTHYILIEKDLMLDDTRALNPEPHYFGTVPVVEYSNSELKQGDFDKVMTLINDYDNKTSDNSNELEYFRNAYLMLKNMMSTEPEDLAAAKNMGAFLVDAEGDVSFVTKEINDAVNEHHLERLDKNIHKFSKTPNLSDESFAGNLSGVAIKYKLFDLETKTITKERFFAAGLRRRWNIINAIWQIKGKNFPLDDLQISFTRNIPSNAVETVDMVAKLRGIVSDETLLAQLPFVDNPEEEMEKRKTQTADAVDDFGSVNKSGDGGNDNA